MATIADYIGDSGKFRVAFWTSYSIDFSTAYFLTRSHLLPLIDKGHCHYLVDARQLDSTCKDSGKLRFFRSLQSVASISASHYKGSFHPKILLLVGESELRLVLTSGNATVGGVLANSDLIARYDFSSEFNDQRATGIIGAAFQYLRNLSGWNELARSHFATAVDVHPWLNSTTNETDFLSSPQNQTLFDRMIARAGKDVDEIEIYSPFFDTDFAVPRKLRTLYPKIPISCWSGKSEIEVLSLNIVDELRKARVNVRGPEGLNKKQFHAKLIRFKRGKESLYFWGSANATRAALLLSDFNAEFLVCEQVTNSNFHIFQSKGRGQDVTLVLRNESKIEEKSLAWSVAIVFAEIKDQQLYITLSNALNAPAAFIRLHFLNEVITIAAKAENDIVIADLRMSSFQILAVDLVSEKGVPISNMVPVCDRAKLDSCAGLSPSVNVQRAIDISDINSLKGELGSLFAFELPEPNENGSQLGVTSVAATDFWTIGLGKNHSLGLWRDTRTLMEQRDSIQSSLEASESLENEKSLDEASRTESVINMPKRSQLKAFSILCKKIEKRMLVACNEKRIRFEASVESGLSLLVEFLFRIIVKSDFIVSSDNIEFYKESFEAICRMHLFFREEATKSNSFAAAQQMDIVPFLKVALMYLMLNFYQREKASVMSNSVEFRLDYPDLHISCIEGEFFVRSYLLMIPDLGETWHQHINDLYEMVTRLPDKSAGKAAFDQVLNVLKKSKPEIVLEKELDFHSHPLFGPCIVENVQKDKIKLRFSLGRTRMFKTQKTEL